MGDDSHCCTGIGDPYSVADRRARTLKGQHVVPEWVRRRCVAMSAVGAGGGSQLSSPQDDVSKHTEAAKPRIQRRINSMAVLRTGDTGDTGTHTCHDVVSPQTRRGWRFEPQKQTLSEPSSRRLYFPVGQGESHGWRLGLRDHIFGIDNWLGARVGLPIHEGWCSVSS